MEEPISGSSIISLDITETVLADCRGYPASEEFPPCNYITDGGRVACLKPECKWERETSNLGAFACKVNICITRRWQRVLWSADYHRDEHLQRQHFHLGEAERRVIGYELQYWLSLRACSARQQEYGTLRPPLSIMKWRGKKAPSYFWSGGSLFLTELIILSEGALKRSGGSGVELEMESQQRGWRLVMW